MVTTLPGGSRVTPPPYPESTDPSPEEVCVPTEAVSLRRQAAGPLPRLTAERARAAAPPDAPPDLGAAQQVACDLGPWVPLPMQGDTLTLWECLATLGAVDLTL